MGKKQSSNIKCYFHELTLLDFSWKAVKGKREERSQKCICQIIITAACIE